MEAIRAFAHCPRCAAAAPPSDGLRPDGPFRCGACAFLLYFNPAGAVAALITRADGHAVFIRRAKDPGKGRLALPGGFVDPGEGAEAALAREVREEIGLETEDLHYLSSHPNTYHYSGVTYHTVDLFFVGRAEAPERAAALDQVDDVLWLDPFTVPLEELAFESMRAALAEYRQRYVRPFEA